jgi:cold-inducible RNA-binding protein
MSRKLFVGNLSHDITDIELERLFAAHGTVHMAHVVLDRGTGRSRGFGFVELDSVEEAQAAEAALHRQKLNGQPLTVHPAHPPPNRPTKRGGYLGKYRSGMSPKP